ncbi:HlyU family transcriptional regulator [Oceanospirillum maris]|uniref:HlyU family transcriptional regulator n=1 Tax=Oceanospirillum maris TaxID=64977 RepID=UPI000422755B|nr:HlyU family transcriptional regulator [Oceanospirillum maris]
MGLFSSLKALFAGGESTPKEPDVMPSETYNDYIITPAPVHEEHSYRINGTITKGEQTHLFIRADALPTQEQCAQEMIRKAKQMIDQQGDRIFN